MARYEHLRLVRVPTQLERRKHGFGKPLPRNRGEHSARLGAQLTDAIEVQRRRRRPDIVSPSLILRVQMTTAPLEEDWEQLGLTVLSSDADRTLVLFSSSDDMQDFRERLAAYAGDIPKDQKHAPYINFVSGIESIGTVEPRDRIGVRLREDGFNDVGDFPENAEQVLDLELWDLGRHELRERKLQDIAFIVQAASGEVIDRYVGASITMMRIRTRGALTRDLLTIEDVASIDLPPKPDLDDADGVLELNLGEVPPPEAVDDDAPVIGIIDTGVNEHPLLNDILIGSIGVPESLGTADDNGHGTRVGGVAVFGDLRAQLVDGRLHRAARLCSAKVLNERGDFDEHSLVPSQMRTAITSLHERFGCRIFVVALGDTKSPFAGRKVGPWAATLDELVRELDIVIIVSAGNRKPRSGGYEELEKAVTEYPRYLVEDDNRFLEPAGATNVITVGSLAHGNGLDSQLGSEVRVQPITNAFEPSPFSRVGPGLRGAVKPDFVDFGGTMVFDPVTARLRDGNKNDLPSAGLLTLHHLG